MRDPVKMATMPLKSCNTTPLQWSERFGDVIKFDIVYGSGTAIGVYCYSMWFVDRQYKHIEQYPLKYMASDELLKALCLFRRDMVGRFSDKIIGDRNFRLIGGQVDAAIEGVNEDRDEKDQSIVTGALSCRQNQNGLPEIK